MLTELKVKSIKPKGRIERFNDGNGLYLEVSKSGSKRWYWRYSSFGKENRLSLGAWPSTSIREAREQCERLRGLLRDGFNPAQHKKHADKKPITFGDVVAELIENQRNISEEDTIKTIQSRLALDVLPVIGDAPIKSIKPTDVLAILRRIEQRKAFETARRVMGICSQVFRYAVAIGAAESDPCRDLRGALVPYAKGKFAALTKPAEVGGLMRAIEDYKGSEVVRSALKFAALTFCRPGEVRHAEWDEIDIEKSEWVIPEHKMKMRVEHTVPMSRQAAKVLERLRPFTGRGLYIFPSPRKGDRPLSNNAMNAALRCMGYTGQQMTAHGFRAMASTLLNELGHRPDVIETQLAHKGADKIRAIYNRAQYMEERRQLMQAWANYLDELASSLSMGQNTLKRLPE